MLSSLYWPLVSTFTRLLFPAFCNPIRLISISLPAAQGEDGETQLQQYLRQNSTWEGGLGQRTFSRTGISANLSMRPNPASHPKTWPCPVCCFSLLWAALCGLGCVGAVQQVLKGLWSSVRAAELFVVQGLVTLLHVARLWALKLAASESRLPKRINAPKPFEFDSRLQAWLCSRIPKGCWTDSRCVAKPWPGTLSGTRYMTDPQCCPCLQAAYTQGDIKGAETLLSQLKVDDLTPLMPGTAAAIGLV